MNVAQVLRQALFDADAVAIDGTTHRFVTQPELLVWAQEGHTLMLNRLRQAHQDFGLTIRASTDADLRWNGIVYDPSSFGLTTTARTYTLPPDLIELRQIRALTSGQESRQFVAKDLTNPDAADLARSESTTTTAGTLYWDIIGERTLRLALPPDTAMDIELSYVARPTKLMIYTTGTVATTQGLTTVTGSGTPAWVINELTPPLDLIISTDANAPVIVGQTAGVVFVDPSVLHSPVASIDTATTLTLAGAYLPASVSGKGYMLASVPSIPDDFQWLLVRYVTAMIRWKASGQPAPDLSDFQVRLGDLSVSTSERQTADPEFVEDYIG